MESEKKGFFSKLFGKGSSCGCGGCCSMKIEEIPEETDKKTDAGKEKPAAK